MFLLKRDLRALEVPDAFRFKVRCDRVKPRYMIEVAR